MPRPCKLKRVHHLPEANQFGPLNQNSRIMINMTIEEYETIRLIDYENYTQIEAAEKMGSSKTTIQGLYDSARLKLAKTIVEGGSLHIIGGNYFIAKPHRRNCRRFKNQGGSQMIIAIPTNKQELTSPISQNLSRAKFIMLFNTETKETTFIDNPAAQEAKGAGVKIAQTLLDHQVTVCITLRCGETAYQVLNGNVEVIKGVDDSLKANVDAYLNNQLTYITEVHKGYHEGN